MKLFTLPKKEKRRNTKYMDGINEMLKHTKQ